MQAVRVATMIDRNTKRALVARAIAEGRTVSAVIRRILERHLEDEQDAATDRQGK